MAIQEITARQFTNQELDHLTNYWCKRRGIKSQDLVNHPQIDDVIILIKYRDTMWPKLNKSEQAHWSALWDWCYHKKFELKKKHLDKLELITIQASDRHIKNLIQQSLVRNRIRQLRQV